MKKLILLGLLVSSPVYADIKHSITSSVKLEAVQQVHLPIRLEVHTVSQETISQQWIQIQQLPWVDLVMLQQAYQQ